MDDQQTPEAPEQAAPEEAQPETAPEETPTEPEAPAEAPQPEPAPAGDTPQEAPPAPEAAPEPEGFLLVEYTMPPGTDTPVYQAGKYWHGGSHYALPATVARDLAQLQGFAVVGPATAPAPRTP